MEETPEGLATAAATREAAKRKRSELEANGVVDEPAAKKFTVPVQAISHEVALPDNYVAEVDSQPELYGMIAADAAVYPSSYWLRDDWPILSQDVWITQDLFNTLSGRAPWPRNTLSS